MGELPRGEDLCDQIGDALVEICWMTERIAKLVDEDRMAEAADLIATLARLALNLRDILTAIMLANN